MTEYQHFTVPKEDDLAQEIKNQEGRNDKERLISWAKNSDFKEDSKNVQSKGKSYIETVIEEKIQELKKKGVIK